MKIFAGLYESTMSVARRIPLLEKFKDSKAWKVLRHRIAQTVEKRENSTFTGFLRLPSQYEALTGPVVNRLAKTTAGSPLRIVVMGCSNGAEAYTIASILLSRCPGIDFAINGYDINPEMCEKARSASYDADEVLNNKLLPKEFIEKTFDIDDGSYRVKEHIAERATFKVADVLNRELLEQVGQCDILFAQNFLFHLDRKDAAKAFDNLCRLLKDQAVFFVDGMDVGLRHKCSGLHRLAPLDFRIEEIHNEARRARASGWPYRYWGLEPFMTISKNWKRRYATIYVRVPGGDPRTAETAL